MIHQLEIEYRREDVTKDDASMLRERLSLFGWQTRNELAVALDWSERKIRDVAESMGGEIVRGQRGFKLTRDITREELGDVAQAADAALSQGKRMIRYGLSLKRKMHQQIET